jgi:hypothetical protein
MHTKNFLKLSIFLSSLFVFNLSVFGQQQFGIKASGGLSKITNSLNPANSILTTPFVPSAQGGLFYNLQFGKRSSMGAELLFSQIEGKGKMETDLYIFKENSVLELVGHMTSTYYQHISYLSLPVNYGYEIKKMKISAGFQISYALSSSGRDKTNATIEGEYETSDNKYDNINIKSFNFGPKAGIIYHLSRKLAIEGSYYYGLNNIQKGDATSWKLKVQQATFGVRYTLWEKGNSNR